LFFLLEVPDLILKWNRAEVKKILLEIPKLKYLKTFIISENKILRFIQEDKEYFIELIGNGYIVRFLAGTTLKEADKRCKNLIKRIKKGGSVLEPIWL